MAKVKLPGTDLEANVGTLVSHVVARVLTVSHKPAREYNGKIGEPYSEVAVQMPSGTFVITADAKFTNLEEDERYTFMVEVENDQYGKAKQPRLRLLQVSPAPAKPSAAPASSAGGAKP